MSTPDVSGGQPAGDTQTERYEGFVDSGPTAEVVETPAPQEPVKTESEEASKDEGQQEEPQKEDKPKKGGYTRKLERLEAQIEQLVSKLADKETPAKTAEKADDAEPNPDDFETHADYYKALGRFTARQELREAEKAKQQESFQAQRQAMIEGYKAKAAEYSKTVPDFAEVIDSADVPVTPAMQQVLLESDLGPQIAYYLAKNPDEAEKVVSMGLVELNRYVGRLEAKLESETSKAVVAKRTTTAPEPIRPVSADKGSTIKSVYDPDLSPDEYARLRRGNT